MNNRAAVAIPDDIQSQKKGTDMKLDHLAVAAESLEAGRDWVEERLGLRLQPAGRTTCSRAGSTGISAPIIFCWGLRTGFTLR